MKKTHQILGFVFLSLLWGTTWLAIKFSLEGLPPFTGACLRFALASIILSFYVYLRKIPLKIKRREFWLLVVTAFLIYFIDYGFIYWGEQYLSAGVTAIFFATFIIFTAIFSNFIFKSEKFVWHKYIGALIGFTGILTVFYDQLVITKFSTKIILASIAILISAAGGAMSTVIIKKYLSRMNAFTLTFYQLIIGTLFLAFYSLLCEDLQKIQLNTRTILAVIYLGVFGSAIAFVVFYKLLKQVSAITISLIIYITPIVAVIVDYIFFGELLPLRSIIGMVVIFSGIWITQLNKKRVNWLLLKLKKKKV